MGHQSLYFDNAASTPVDPEVLLAMQECMGSAFGNPSSVHAEGRRARVLLEESRRTVARLLGVSPAEVFFTSGATEAISTLLWGCSRSMGLKHVVSSGLEHPAVLQTLEDLVKYGDARVSFVDVDHKGHVDQEHLAFLLKQYSPSLLCLMHANNELGNLLPVNDTAALCAKHGAYFMSDTVQTIGKFKMDLSALPFDFAVASAHKFHGPKGVGFMYVRGGLKPAPLIRGGGQERNMRAGTENLPGIVGLAKALEVADRDHEKHLEHIRGLRQHCMDRLKREVPEVSFNGDARGHSLYTILNLSLPEHVDAETLLPRIDMEGICLSGGSACASGSLRGSHVLTAIGANPNRPSLRVSFGKYNTPEQVDVLTGVLKSICRRPS